MTEDPEFWYRYEDQRWSVTVNAELEVYATRLEVLEYKYRVVRKTSKGAWLEVGYFDQQEKWVGLGRGKRFAYPTKEEALQGYIARKRRQIQIYTKRLEQAREFEEMAKAKLMDFPADIQLR